METRRGLAAAAVVVAFAGCGVIRGAPPEQPEAVGPTGAGREVFLDVCGLVSDDEVGSALGAPVIERSLLVDEGRHASSCEYRTVATGAGVSARVSVDPETVEAKPITSQNQALQRALQPLEGVGAHAGYVPPIPPDGTGGLVMAVTPEGVSMMVVVEPSPGDAQLKDKTVAIARLAATRASERFPGDPAALPSPSSPPIDLCGALPVGEQLGVLGWAPTSRESPLGSVVEYVGQPAGGTWECSRSRGNPAGGLPDAGLVIELTREPLPAAQWERGAAVADIGRGARVVRGQGPRPGAPLTAVYLQAAGGRRLGVSLWDRTLDAARVEKASVELAKLVAKRVAP